jgi:hypothetical protein
MMPPHVPSAVPRFRTNIEPPSGKDAVFTSIRSSWPLNTLSSLAIAGQGLHADSVVLRIAKRGREEESIVPAAQKKANTGAPTAQDVLDSPALFDPAYLQAEAWFDSPNEASSSLLSSIDQLGYPSE